MISCRGSDWEDGSGERSERAQKSRISRCHAAPTAWKSRQSRRPRLAIPNGRNLNWVLGRRVLRGDHDEPPQPHRERIIIIMLD